MTIKASVESGGWSVDNNWSSFVNPALKHILVAAGWFKQKHRPQHRLNLYVLILYHIAIGPSVETKAQIHAASPDPRRFMRPRKFSCVTLQSPLSYTHQMAESQIMTKGSPIVFPC